MKKIITLIAGVFVFSCAFAQLVRTRDTNRNNQMKSMEFMQWKFTPKWYYYSMSQGGMLGLHSRYVDEYDNNIKEYSMSLAYIIYQEKKAKQQEEDTKKQWEQETKKFADRSIDVAFIQTAVRRAELIALIIAEYNKLADNGVKINHRLKVMDELTRITANVKIINDSHIGRAKKREAYLDFEKQLEELLLFTAKFVEVSKLIKQTNYVRIN